MFMLTYNAMIEGFVAQIDAQVGRRLFEWNEFPGMTQRPKLVADPINKVSLQALSTILGPLAAAMDFGDDDIIAIRKQTGFLPENLPEPEEGDQPEGDAPADEPDGDLDQAPAEEDGDAGTQGDAERQADTVAQAQRRALAWQDAQNRAKFAAFEKLERS